MQGWESEWGGAPITELIVSPRKWSGAGAGVGVLRGTGTHRLIILDLEVYQEYTIVNSRFYQKMGKPD